MVNVPAMAITGTPPDWASNCRVLPAVVEVIELKVMLALLVIVDVLLLSFKIIVPELWMNVPPVLVKFWEMVKFPEGAVRVPKVSRKLLVTAAAALKVQPPPEPLKSIL